MLKSKGGRTSRIKYVTTQKGREAESQCKAKHGTVYSSNPTSVEWGDHKGHLPCNPSGIVDNGLAVVHTVRTCLTMSVLATDFPTWQAK